MRNCQVNMFGHAFLDTLLITLRDLKRLVLRHIRLIVTKVHGKTKKQLLRIACVPKALYSL